MARLTKGMYGSEFSPTCSLFGLSCGQMRGGNAKITHNSGWYNKAGEKLGWGDLSAEDFQRISDELEDGELFVILNEQDSFWSFVTHNPGIIGSMCMTKREAEAPGTNYVAERAMYIIARGQLYHVARYGISKRETVRLQGLRFKSLKPDAVKALMA